MKFRTLGRTLLLLAGTAGLTFSLTSCSADHTVGYVYVLGADVASASSGQISSFQEDNNRGDLTPLRTNATLSSGGVNPIRAVVPSGNRFMYVLNAGLASQPDGNGAVTYSSANIQLFSIGGYGQLTQQLSYNSQGFGSERIAIDGAGAHLFVLDTYANVNPSTASAAPTAVLAGGATPTGAGTNYPCVDATDSQVYHPVGAITVFSIDPSTGRLQLQQNQRQLGLTYFPVGCNPLDFRLSASYLYTLDGGASSNSDIQTIYTYAVSSSTGQLTPAQTQVSQIASGNSSGVAVTHVATITGDSNPNTGYGISKYIYLLDPLANTGAGAIYAYTIGSNGAPTQVNGSPFDNLGTQAGGPRQTYTDSTGKYLFVVNGGPTNNTQANADITAFIPNATTGDLNTQVQTSGFTLGSVSGPVCIFEDPTNQYFYVAGSLDNSITGRKINPNAGTLADLTKNGTVPTVQTPTWCLGVANGQ